MCGLWLRRGSLHPMTEQNVDLTEALAAAAEAYGKHHWTEGSSQPYRTAPDNFDLYRIKQALLPLIEAAAPFIIAQCPRVHTDPTESEPHGH